MGGGPLFARIERFWPAHRAVISVRVTCLHPLRPNSPNGGVVCVWYARLSPSLPRLNLFCLNKLAPFLLALPKSECVSTKGHLTTLQLPYIFPTGIGRRMAEPVQLGCAPFPFWSGRPDRRAGTRQNGQKRHRMGTKHLNWPENGRASAPTAGDRETHRPTWPLSHRTGQSGTLDRQHSRQWSRPLADSDPTPQPGPAPPPAPPQGGGGGDRPLKP